MLSMDVMIHNKPQLLVFIPNLSLERADVRRLRAVCFWIGKSLSVGHALFLKYKWALLHKFRLECVGCRAHRCLVHRSGDSGVEAMTETPYQMWLCSNLGTLGNHFAHRTGRSNGIAAILRRNFRSDTDM